MTKQFVMPEIVHRASICSLWQMNLHNEPPGLTTRVFSVETTGSISSDRVPQLLYYFLPFHMLLKKFFYAEGQFQIWAFLQSALLPTRRERANGQNKKFHSAVFHIIKTFVDTKETTHAYG